MPKPGDIRILADWCESWYPREDGEFYVDDQTYCQQCCNSEKEAARVAQKNDIHGEGSVITQEWQELDFGIYDWVTIEDVGSWEKQ